MKLLSILANKSNFCYTAALLSHAILIKRNLIIYQKLGWPHRIYFFCFSCRKTDPYAHQIATPGDIINIIIISARITKVLTTRVNRIW